MTPPPIPAKDACGFHIGPRQAQWITDYARAYAQKALDEAIAIVNALPEEAIETSDWRAGEATMRDKAAAALATLRSET